MNFRSLFDPGSLNPYRPPSLTLSSLMILVGIVAGYTQISGLNDYLDLRYGTVMARGVVVSVSNRQNIESTGRFGEARPHTESVVAYSFKIPNERTYTGTVVRPAVRLDHLTAQAPVEVFYKSDDPNRNTIGDDLFYRFWWQLFPAAALATFWLGLSGMFIAQAIMRRRRDR